MSDVASEGPPDELPPCLDCGACCFGDLPRYVRVTGDDHARLGDAADELTEWHGNQLFMRMVDGHCAALAIDGTAASFTCQVYERRPRICRVLERGSGACRAEREAKSDRTLVALGRRRSSAIDPVGD